VPLQSVVTRSLLTVLIGWSGPGIVLGLGLGFMLEGIKMMSSGWLIATVAMTGTLLLLPPPV
jgi:integral membrane sensor domain MASE1